MKVVLLNMVWPAIYVSEALSRCWFLVLGTIVIELFVISYFLKFSWKKSFFASLIGNCVSGFAGTIVMNTGVIDYKRIFDAASTAGMKHFFVEHDFPKDAYESLNISFKNLSKMLG